MSAGLSTVLDEGCEDWRWVADNVASSYRANCYGDLLYYLIRTNAPEHCVEIGTLHGYSALYITAALRDNGHGHLDCYDLWETYPFRHSRMVDVQERIDCCGLHNWVTLHHCDAMHVPGQLKSWVDFVHVDISNDGDTYLWAASAFGDGVLTKEGLLVLEGGTPDRDTVEWMAQGYHKPISAVLESLTRDWAMVVMRAFPGMTIMRRR